CNEVWPKKNGRPSGCAEFGLWRRCSSVTDPLRDMLPPRVLPQAKLGATNVIVFMNWSTKESVLRSLQDTRRVSACLCVVLFENPTMKLRTRILATCTLATVAVAF